MVCMSSNESELSEDKFILLIQHLSQVCFSFDVFYDGFNLLFFHFSEL